MEKLHVLKTAELVHNSWTLLKNHQQNNWDKVQVLSPRVGLLPFESNWHFPHGWDMVASIVSPSMDLQTTLLFQYVQGVLVIQYLKVETYCTFFSGAGSRE